MKAVKIDKNGISIEQQGFLRGEGASLAAQS